MDVRPIQVWYGHPLTVYLHMFVSNLINGTDMTCVPTSPLAVEHIALCTVA